MLLISFKLLLAIFIKTIPAQLKTSDKINANKPFFNHFFANFGKGLESIKVF